MKLLDELIVIRVEPTKKLFLALSLVQDGNVNQLVSIIDYSILTWVFDSTYDGEDYADLLSNEFNTLTKHGYIESYKVLKHFESGMVLACRITQKGIDLSGNKKFWKEVS